MNTLKKIGSLLLAFVVLFSTLSFTIDKHYCGSILVDVAINKKAKSCCASLKKDHKEAITKKSCCKDERILIIGQDELKKSVAFNWDVQLVAILQADFFSFDQVYTDLEQSKVYFNVNDPPDRNINFQILYQTYLI